MGLSNACMKKIIIYGINQQAEQLYAYLTQEHVWVEAFCVDRDYYTKNTLCGKPVICFENIHQKNMPYFYLLGTKIWLQTEKKNTIYVNKKDMKFPLLFAKMRMSILTI